MPSKHARSPVPAAAAAAAEESDDEVFEVEKIVEHKVSWACRLVVRQVKDAC